MILHYYDTNKAINFINSYSKLNEEMFITNLAMEKLYGSCLTKLLINESYVLINEDEEVKNGFMSKAWEAIKNFFKKIRDFIMNIYKKIKNFFKVKEKEAVKIVEEVKKVEEQIKYKKISLNGKSFIIKFTPSPGYFLNSSHIKKADTNIREKIALMEKAINRIREIASNPSVNNNSSILDKIGLSRKKDFSDKRTTRDMNSNIYSQKEVLGVDFSHAPNREIKISLSDIESKANDYLKNIKDVQIITDVYEIFKKKNIDRLNTEIDDLVEDFNNGKSFSVSVKDKSGNLTGIIRNYMDAINNLKTFISNVTSDINTLLGQKKSDIINIIKQIQTKQIKDSDEHGKTIRKEMGSKEAYRENKKYRDENITRFKDDDLNDDNDF